MRYLVALIFLCLVGSAMIYFHYSTTVTPSATIEPPQNKPDVSGVYEFVSETTIARKPKTQEWKIAAPEWQGIWFFQQGHFSQVFMKKGRGFLNFPRYYVDVGYLSFAGTYQVEGDSVRLVNDCSLHPLEVGSQAVFSYRFEGNNLVLTETLLPTIENNIEGERIIVLKKLQ